MSYIKTKSEDASLIIVDNELYISDNPNVRDGQDADGEITFQLFSDGKKDSLTVNANGHHIELGHIQFQILKQFLNGDFQ